MYRHISHFLLFPQVNGVPHSLLWCYWLFGQEDLPHVEKNLEKQDKVVSWTRGGALALSLFSSQLCLQFGCSLSARTFVLRHVSMNERLDGNRKKAFWFYNFLYEGDPSVAGAQLFLVGLNFRSANARGCAAHLYLCAWVYHRVAGGPMSNQVQKSLQKSFLSKQ